MSEKSREYKRKKNIKLNKRYEFLKQIKKLLKRILYDN